MKFFFCILFFISCAFGQKIYINSADYEELKSLPLSQDKVSDLYDFIMFQGPLNSIYDLKKIQSFDAKDIDALKPLISMRAIKNSGSKVSRISDPVSYTHLTLPTILRV